MYESINLSEARKKLPEITDLANTGHTYLLSRRGRELAVLIGVEEYRRLKAIEERQRKKDFDAILTPPPRDALGEEAASELAAEIIRKQRARYTSPRE